MLPAILKNCVLWIMRPLPTKIIRKRFNNEIIAELLKIKWWDWSKEKITKNIKAIVGVDLKRLKNAL